MIEQIAKADGAPFEDDPERFHRLALAALKPVARPTEAMVDAAHEAVWSVPYWAISGRADIRLLDTNKDPVVNQRAKRPVAVKKDGCD
jgi:hypothetical protein